MTASFAGLSLARPLIMGIINVTPDSFSDGGLALDPAEAVARGRMLLDDGADISLLPGVPAVNYFAIKSAFGYEAKSNHPLIHDRTWGVS